MEIVDSKLEYDDKLATEATIMGKKILPPDGYLVGKITQTDNGMLVEYVEKKPQYPKTYDECAMYIDVSGYTDEYVLSLWSNDGVLEIGCEPLKVDGKYINPCGDITFLVSNCSSKIIPLCESSELYFVDIDEECCCAEHRYDDCVCDDDIYGFTVVKEDDDGYHSYTYYTDSILDEEDIHTLLKKIGF